MLVLLIAYDHLVNNLYVSNIVKGFIWGVLTYKFYANRVAMFDLVAGFWSWKGFFRVSRI